MRQEFIDARALKIMECAAKDMRVVEAAEHLGLTTVTIYKYAKLYNISFSRDLAKLVRESACLGLTRAETAKKLAICYSIVCQIARDENIEFIRVYTHQEDVGAEYQKRADIMAALYRDGYTLEKIGEQYGITRERVRQIISKVHGLSGADGGKHVTAIKNQRRKASKKDASFFKKYGCTHAEWLEFVELGKVMMAEGKGAYRTPTGAFRCQKRNAKNRGIGWELTIIQWWQIWQDSGKWDERGRGKGYVMCRHGDEGPYAVGNVFIDTGANNSSVSPKSKKSGLPIGVHHKIQNTENPFVAMRCKKYLGSFKSPELAHAAYLMAGAA